MQLKGLIFDFDGLILDTELPEFQAWQEIYQSYGLDLPLSEWSKAIGTSSACFDPCYYLEEQTGARVDHNGLNALQKTRALAIIYTLEMLPGVMDMLNAARKRGMKLGLASSSPRESIHSHLDRLGLKPYFDAVCTGDQVACIKPNPDLYQCALKRMGLEPDEAIAFEDSPNGITAAKAAGLYCIAVPNALTRQLDVNHADLIIHSMTELPLDLLLEQF
jgi:HAD superfamily hydrolase (TIGR01509 family)